MQLSKIQMIVVAVVALAVVVAAGVVIAMNGNSGNDPVTEGVIYHGNGGTTENGDTVYGYTNKTVQSSQFSYKDHAFVSWNTREDGKGTVYKVGDPISYNPKIALYAQWGFSGSFSVPLLMGINCVLVDSHGNATPILNTVAMPADGVAGIAITNKYDWSYDKDNNKFIGFTKDGMYKYTAFIDIESKVSDMSTKLVDGMPTCVFSFDGPVKGSITVIRSTT